MNATDPLRAIPIFAGLDEEALAYLASRLHPRDYPVGADIVREGQPNDGLYVITAGQVRILKATPGGGASELARLGPGDFFGEMSFLECTPRSATATCETDTDTLHLRSTDLHPLYEHQPRQYAILILNIARDVARRLHRLDERYAARA